MTDLLDMKENRKLFKLIRIFIKNCPGIRKQTIAMFVVGCIVTGLMISSFLLSDDPFSIFYVAGLPWLYVLFFLGLPVQCTLALSMSGMINSSSYMEKIYIKALPASFLFSLLVSCIYSYGMEAAFKELHGFSVYIVSLCFVIYAYQLCVGGIENKKILYISMMLLIIVPIIVCNFYTPMLSWIPYPLIVSAILSVIYAVVGCIFCPKFLIKHGYDISRYHGKDGLLRGVDT